MIVFLLTVIFCLYFAYGVDLLDQEVKKGAVDNATTAWILILLGPLLATVAIMGYAVPNQIYNALVSKIRKSKKGKFL